MGLEFALKTIILTKQGFISKDYCMDSDSRRLSTLTLTNLDVITKEEEMDHLLKKIQKINTISIEKAL
mgnify:FL=1